MPSPTRRSPRIQLTLSPEAMALLSEISALTGQGKATLVSEIIDGMLPVLQANIEALRIVKEAPREAQAMLARASNEVVMKLSQAQMEFDDILSATPAPKRQKRNRKGMADGPP